VSTQKYVDWKALQQQIEQGLGRLSMEFSKLETALACGIGYFVSASVSVGQIVGGEMGFKAKVALFSSLCLHHTPNSTAVARLKTFRKHVEEVELRRNSLLHSFYWPDSSGSAALLRIKTTAKPAKGLQIEFERITPQDVDDVLQKLDQVTDELDGILLDFHREYQDYAEHFYASFSHRGTAG
jgi:hypothetical protein